MKYYISDLHFFHDNIRRFCHRPFDNIEQMEKAMIENWNRVVKPDDEVYVLGDMFYRATSPNDIRRVLKQLSGKKYLIRGNHDKWANDKSLTSFFEWIKPYDEVEDNGRRVILFHYPIEEWNGYFRDSYHLYGHVHNAGEQLTTIPRRFNVSADVVEFTPRTLNQLIARN